jgi:hypothetical protein
MPKIAIYDLECKVYEHLKASENDLYKSVGFPVNVFYWTCKHKKTSDACTINCNPTNFKELLREDQKTWFFDSSIAEKTNVLLGGYHSILHEMAVGKYNFFLNEMILRKNRLIKIMLEQDGSCPDYISELIYTSS